MKKQTFWQRLFDRSIQRYVQFVERHSLRLVLLTGIVTIGLGLGIPRLRIVEEASEKLTSPDHPIMKSILEVSKHFGSNSRPFAISIESLGDFALTQPHALELIKKITEAAQRAPSVLPNTTMSLSTATEFRTEGDELVAEPLIQQWPRSRAEERALQQLIKKDGLVYGRLISKDFRSAIVIGSGSTAGTLTDIHNDLTEAIRPYQSSIPGIRVQLVGDSEVNYQISATIKDDLALFASMSFLFVLVGFFLAFRTWQGVVLPAVTIVSGIVWTMGIIGWIGYPVHIMAATVPVVLVVIGNACAIHVYHYLHEGVRGGLSFRDSLSSLAHRHFGPILLSTFTTFIGGLSLITFNLIPIQMFGIFTAMGTLIAVGMAILVIPAYYRLFFGTMRRFEDSVAHGMEMAADLAKNTLENVPVAGKVTETLAESLKATVQGGLEGAIEGARKTNATRKILKEFATWVDDHPWRIVFACLTLIAIGSWGATRIIVNFDDTELLPRNNPLRAATKQLEKDFGGLLTFEMMLDSGRPNGALEPVQLARLRRFVREAEQIEQVSQTLSVLDVLEKVHRLLNPESRSPLPESREAAAQYLLLIGMSAKNLALSRVVNPDNSRLKVSIVASGNDSRVAEQVLGKLETLAQKHLANMKPVFAGAHMIHIVNMRNVVWGKVQNVVSSMMFVFLVLVLVYRSISRGLVSLITMPVGIAANFGLMGFAHIPLDLVSAVVTSIAMGVGTDLTIHMITAIKDRFRRTKNMSQSVRGAVLDHGEAMIYNGLSDIMGFSILFFSRFAAIQTLGILMVFSLFVLQISALLLVPAYLRIAEPEFITRNRLRSQVREPGWSKVLKFATATGIIGACSYLVWLIEGWA